MYIIRAWQTLLRTPLVGNGRQSEDTAGRGLMSTLQPEKFEEEEEEEPQLEEETKLI